MASADFPNTLLKYKYSIVSKAPKTAAHLQQSIRSLRFFVNHIAAVELKAAVSPSPHKVNFCAFGADDNCRLPSRALVMAGMPMRIMINRRLLRRWIVSRCIGRRFGADAPTIAGKGGASDC